MRQKILIVILLAIGGVLAHLYVEAQSYYPVAKIQTPDGFTFLAVQKVTAERNACGAANDRFLEPIKARCKDCKVLYARCERELDSVERTLAMGYGEPHYMIVAPGLHMKVEGPRLQAKAVCDQLASDLSKRWQERAACVYPRGTPAG